MSNEKTEQVTAMPESTPSTFSYLTDEEKKMNEDYEWCLHDPDVRRLYGNQVVVAHQRRIWGAGKDHLAAWNAAQRHPNCPHRRVCVFVVVPCLAPASLDSSTTDA
jgi:hypothetical protein